MAKKAATILKLGFNVIASLNINKVNEIRMHYLKHTGRNSGAQRKGETANSVRYAACKGTKEIDTLLFNKKKYKHPL